MPDIPPATPNKTMIASIMLILAIWLLVLLIFASWFQSSYISSYTQHNPDFLQSSYTEQWFTDLSPLLPKKQTVSRVIQFWKPGCLCNRFARPHALSAMVMAKDLNIEHITLIPTSAKDQLDSLQELNPDTRILLVDPSQLPQWPASPALIIEGPNTKPIYFGPLGFGAFCGQSSSSIINIQLSNLSKPEPKAFFNVVGQGCFCPWK